MAERLRRSTRNRMGFPARVRISLTATFFFCQNETTTEPHKTEAVDSRLWIDQHVVPVRWFRTLGWDRQKQRTNIFFFLVLHFEAYLSSCFHIYNFYIIHHTSYSVESLKQRAHINCSKHNYLQRCLNQTPPPSSYVSSSSSLS